MENFLSDLLALLSLASSTKIWSLMVRLTKTRLWTPSTQSPSLVSSVPSSSWSGMTSLALTWRWSLSSHALFMISSTTLPEQSLIESAPKRRRLPHHPSELFLFYVWLLIVYSQYSVKHHNIPGVQKEFCEWPQNFRNKKLSLLC